MSSEPAEPKVVARLLLDKAADPAIANARDQFEAFARSMRDVLAQRWALAAKFSTDRSIAQYAKDIWRVLPCPVS